MACACRRGSDDDASGQLCCIPDREPGHVDHTDTYPTVIHAPGTAPGTRLREYASSELARAIECLGWRGPRLHDGVHQARKSLRRTRATLALGMPALGPGTAVIDRELRRLNRSLSKLRDAHALVTVLDRMIDKSAGEDAAVTVLRRARRTAARMRAACAHKALAADPMLQDKRALLAVLLAALPALQWPAISTAGARDALRRSAAAADAAGAQARASGEDEDWHGWRRRARRLSQQQRALDDPTAPRSPIKQDKRLAVLLGEAQDHAMVRERCGKKSPFAQADRQTLRSLAESRLRRLREDMAASASKPAPSALGQDLP